MSCYRCISCTNQIKVTGERNYSKLATSQNKITQLCGSFLNVRLLSGLINSDINFINTICSNIPKYCYTYYGPGDDDKCPVVMVDISALKTHPCDHCDGGYSATYEHTLVCVYDLF